MNRSIAIVVPISLVAAGAVAQEAGARRVRARDHLFARAIVVDDGSTGAVLVGIDLRAAGNQIVDDAIPRASEATGSPAQNVIISAIRMDGQ